MLRPIYQKTYRALIRPILRPIYRDFVLSEPIIFGDPARVTVAPTAVLMNALLNVLSGTIEIGDYVFFGHNVCVLTGTHDIENFFQERMLFPTSGRDIVICTGAWISSGAMIIGPRVVGEHAVVAAGAVVVDDVSPFSIVAGVPAKVVGSVLNRPNKARPD